MDNKALEKGESPSLEKLEKTAKDITEALFPAIDSWKNPTRSHWNRIARTTIECFWIRIKPYLAKQDEWIKIENRKNPIPKDKDCLICFEDGTIMRYSEEDWPALIITHWKPLPTPPMK